MKISTAVVAGKGYSLGSSQCHPPFLSDRGSRVIYQHDNCNSFGHQLRLPKSW